MALLQEMYQRVTADNYFGLLFYWFVHNFFCIKTVSDSSKGAKWHNNWCFHWRRCSADTDSFVFSFFGEEEKYKRKFTD